MGKFARKMSRTRCLSGKIRYETRAKAAKGMKEKYVNHGVRTEAVFCVLCGAFHLEKMGAVTKEERE